MAWLAPRLASAVLAAALATASLRCGPSHSEQNPAHDRERLEPAMAQVANQVPAMRQVLRDALPVVLEQDSLVLRSTQERERPHVVAKLQREGGSTFEIGTSDAAPRLLVTRTSPAVSRLEAGQRYVRVTSSENRSESFWFSTRAGVEELVRVDEGTALTYRWELPEGVHVLPGGRRRATFQHRGKPWLSVSVPAAWDARGERVDVWLSVRERSLKVHWAGAPEMPVWIDPAWANAGATPMSIEQHTSTLLLDGSVLLVGKHNEQTTAIRYTPLQSLAESRFEVLTAPQHEFETATLLPSGRVLLAGGGTGTATADASLFDPATGSFVEVPGGMLTARSGHTATLLPSGRVLLAGGNVDFSTTNSLELYDPAGAPEGKFLDAGPMAQRSSHTATLLRDGRVLIAGGYGVYGKLATTELFAEAAGGTGSIAPGPDLSAVRASHTATLLGNGNVLLTGGCEQYWGDCTTTEMYVAVLGEPGSLVSGPSMNASRMLHTATLLPSGEVLFVGQDAFQQPEIFGIDGLFRNAPAPDPLKLPQSGHAATLLPNGNALITGGRNEDESYDWNNVNHYDPYLGEIQCGEAETLTLPHPTADGHSATLLLSGKVLILGGSDTNGVSNRASLLDPRTGEVTDVGPMREVRTQPSATLLADGRVLIAGGCQAECPLFDDSEVLASAEIYDPMAGPLGAFQPAPSMHTPRAYHQATLLPNGRVLLTGGKVNQDKWGTAEAELYDPATNTFLKTANMLFARIGHTATLLPDGRVLIVGSAPVEGTLEFDPTAEVFYPLDDGGGGEFRSTARPRSQRLFHTATLLADGRVLFAGGLSITAKEFLNTAELFDPTANSYAGAFVATDSMTRQRVGHTAVLMPDNRVWILGGTEGYDSLLSEVFDAFGNEGGGAFVPVSGGPSTRSGTASTLLPDGRVLVVGATSGSSCDIITPYVVTSAIPRPKITAAPASLFARQPGPVQGVGLRNPFAGSSGRSNDSAANVPIGVWMRMGGGGLIPVELRDFTESSANAHVTTSALAGPGILFPIINGIVGEGLPTVIAPGALGSECHQGAECGTGFCAEEVCCDQPCDRACWSCVAIHTGAGADGVCAPVRAGQDPLAACLERGTSTCGTDGLCDGKGQCRSYDKDTPCGGGHLCAGKGEPCPETCTEAGQCETGYACDLALQDCVLAVATCDGDHRVSSPTGTQDCTPYRCADRSCLQSCNSSAACALGYVCDAVGHCVAPGPVHEPERDLGCTCNLEVPSRFPAGPAFFTLLLLGVRRRRRRCGGP